MTTAVIDTNVLASGFVRANPAAAPTQLIDAWHRGAFALVVSDHILAELTHTFEDRYFQRRFTAQQCARALTLLRRGATIIPITVEIHGVATHPEDDLVLATAVSAHADYLITGDAMLRKLRTYQGVTIASPRKFVRDPHDEGGKGARAGNP